MITIFRGSTQTVKGAGEEDEEDGFLWACRELFVGCIFSVIEPNMKGGDAFVV